MCNEKPKNVSGSFAGITAADGTRQNGRKVKCTRRTEPLLFELSIRGLENSMSSVPTLSVVFSCSTSVVNVRLCMR